MTISTDIFAALQGLVGSRCYPDTFEQPSGGMPTWPAIRYNIVGGDTHPDICGTGDGEQDTPLVQIDVVAASHAERETLCAQVRSAMASLATATTLQGVPRREPDAETKTYRASFDYLFHL